MDEFNNINESQNSDVNRDVNKDVNKDVNSYTNTCANDYVSRENDFSNASQAEPVRNYVPYATTITDPSEAKRILKEAKKKAKTEKAEAKKAKRAARKNSVGRKCFAAILAGLLFGAAAAGSFYGVNRIAGVDLLAKFSGNDDIKQVESSISDLEKLVISNMSGNNAIAAPVSNETFSTVVTDVTEVAKKVMPAMVSVTNQGETIISYWGRQYSQESTSSGSGIIIGESDTEYLIATNHHVIENSKILTVQFADEQTANAYVKGYDSSMDIAVIGVSKTDMSIDTRAAVRVAELGNSDSLQIGEPAIAIGNALGYGQSVTTGVISALDRRIEIDDGSKFDGLIQTSAAINPGNSGGALLNIKGQVIGINSSKIGGSTIEGMGFAIPISEVKDIIGEFASRETKQQIAEEERGYLGISGSNTVDYNLTQLGYPAGIYVTKIYESSDAVAAGLFTGDVITKLNSQTVTTIEQLQEALSYYRIGEKVSLTFTRNVDGRLKEMSIEVTLISKSSFENEE